MSNTLYPKNPIRRIQVTKCEDSGRYQTWSLLQEILNAPYRNLLIPQEKKSRRGLATMDNSNITMEEYISLEEEKAQKPIIFNDNLTSNERLSCEPTISSFNNNEIDLRISFDEFDDEDYTVIFNKNSFSYKIISANDLKKDLKNDNKKVNMPLFPSTEPSVEGYTKEIVHNFEQRLEMIFERQVNRVHILDFEGLTLDMRQDLAERLRMVYTRDDGQEVFVSHAWKRLFETRAPLVHEFILEFFNTYRIDSLHTAEEMAEDRFDAYWLGSERVISNEWDRSDNVPYVLVQYLFRHTEGRKSDARLSRRHFIGHLAHHFGLVSDDGLRGLSIMTRDLALIDMGDLVKLNICSSGRGKAASYCGHYPRGAEDAPDIFECAQAVPAPIHAPQHHHQLQAVPAPIHAPQHHHQLQEIIEKGNTPIVTKTVDGKETVIPPTSVEEKAQRRAELKARSSLLMALPNEH
nr:hypothetical protein [Tanacetum cinerariifolium]